MEDQTREALDSERPEIGSEDHAKRVAQQNDQFRRWHCIGERKPGVFVPGQSVWTAAFEARDPEFKRAALEAIGAIKTFEAHNDPDGFHDFGAIEIDGETVWFKIDHYDQNYHYGSEDPSDLKATCRVLTILFPSDW